MGLDDFSTEGPRKSSKSKDRESAEDSVFHDIVKLRAGKELTPALLETIRQKYVPDYYPDLRLEDGWDYKEAALVKCVCGEKVLVEDHTNCSDCGRGYANTDRAVVMTKRGKS